MTMDGVFVHTTLDYNMENMTATDLLPTVKKTTGIAGRSPNITISSARDHSEVKDPMLDTESIIPPLSLFSDALTPSQS